MAIEPICDRCGEPLTEPGGLLFGPPDADGKVVKAHLCVTNGCYVATTLFVGSGQGDDGGN